MYANMVYPRDFIWLRISGSLKTEVKACELGAVDEPKDVGQLRSGIL